MSLGFKTLTMYAYLSNEYILKKRLFINRLQN